VPIAAQKQVMDELANAVQNAQMNLLRSGQAQPSGHVVAKKVGEQMEVEVERLEGWVAVKEYGELPTLCASLILGLK